MPVFLRLRTDPARAELEDSLDRLRLYVGENWDAHYHDPFTKLLRALSSGGSAGWTWNWSAALLPLWFLYRRLYAAFVLVFVAHALLFLLDPHLPGTGVLRLGLVVVQGCWGDRLLFDRAVDAVESSGDRAHLALVGKPNVWASVAFAWAWFAFVVVAVLSLPDPLNPETATNMTAANTAAAHGTGAGIPGTGLPAAPIPRLEVVTATDGRSQVTLPASWKVLWDLNEAAGIQAGNARGTSTRSCSRTRSPICRAWACGATPACGCRTSARS